MSSESWLQRQLRHWGTLRRPVPLWEASLLGSLTLASCLGIWWFLTSGEAEARRISAVILPSPAETFRVLPSLWNDYALTRNTLVTLKRVTLGFGLSIAVGVPLGILGGCFPRIGSLLAPLIMFGRNVPIAATLPLMFLFFGGETLKIMFIFVASVAFVLADASRAVTDVAARYVDTAYTLGANRWQTMTKVLVPLAMPSIFQSCRLLYGLAFGYIMLAEVVRDSQDIAAGLGAQISIFQRQSLKAHIILIILIIPLIALCVDKLLLLLQKQLFPHVYGGDGLLHQVMRQIMHLWDDVKRSVFGKVPPPAGPGIMPAPALKPSP